MKRAWFAIGGFIPSMLCVLVGVALGLGVYVFHYAEGGSYFSTDPKSCMNCHIMREAYDSWQKSSHHGAATCNDCHTPHDPIGKLVVKADNGFWHSKAFTLQDYHDPLLIRPRNSRVLQQSCLYCHGDLVGDIAGHGETEYDGAVGCVRCHVSVGHGQRR